MTRSISTVLIFSLALPTALLTVCSGCGAQKAMRAPSMRPLALAREKPPQNPFKRDKVNAIAEKDLQELLSRPVFLREKARVGVLPVSTGYAPDGDLPLDTVPGEVSTALESSGLFEVTTEVTTDWPTDRGIGGLRELAARYRCEYLLLYRHRFIDREWTNGWGALYMTVVGALFVPSHTLETAGVLEATLFDVRSGSLLFTVYERVHARTNENVWQNNRKRRELKEKLLGKAAKRLADVVVGKTRRLAAVRPEPQPQEPSKLSGLRSGWHQSGGALSHTY